MYMQIYKGDYYHEISENNRIQFIELEAPRGKLISKDGSILATSRSSFDLLFIPTKQAILSLEKVARSAGEILGRPEGVIRDKIKEETKYSYRPILIAEDISLEEVIKISEHQDELPQLRIQVNFRRFYPEDERFAHLLGYMGEVDKYELSLLAQQGYRQRDLIGKMGLERIFDKDLRGNKGLKQIEVDVRGRQLKLLKEVEPEPGADLVLTIDSRLQEAAFEALGDSQGGIVVMNPENGEILSLVSKPAFNPNYFNSKKDEEKIPGLLADPKKPLMNRATQAQYAPGSTFKIVVAAAALENQVIDEKTLFYDGGIFYLNGHPFHSWMKWGQGWVNISKAIAWSNNVFFYQLGLKTGAEKIALMAKKFGLGKPTGIILSEKKGLIPDPAWKKETFKDKWYPGDTVNASIGQGWILATPLQMASLISAVANGGTLFKPTLVKGKEPEVLNQSFLSSETLKILRESLEKAVREGTGTRARISNVRIAGKTGTAQNPHGKDHAWFLCYAPSEDPTIAIAVLIENGGSGGSVAAPVARKILEKAFEVNN